MRVLVLAAVFVLALALAPSGRSEATSYCGASPSVVGSSTVQPVAYLSTSSQVYITAVCASVGGHEHIIIQGGQLTAVDGSGCYMFFKSQHYAFISRGPHWSASCPVVRLTVRTVKSVGSAG